jgi:hypothetical protein
MGLARLSGPLVAAFVNAQCALLPLATGNHFPLDQLSAQHRYTFSVSVICALLLLLSISLRSHAAGETYPVEPVIVLLHVVAYQIMFQPAERAVIRSLLNPCARQKTRILRNVSSGLVAALIVFAFPIATEDHLLATGIDRHNVLGLHRSVADFMSSLSCFAVVCSVVGSYAVWNGISQQNVFKKSLID